MKIEKLDRQFFFRFLFFFKNFAWSAIRTRLIEKFIEYKN